MTISFPLPTAQGGCLCGEVRYRVTGKPRSACICHCESCRKASASPSVAWLTFGCEHFEILSGSPARFRSSVGVMRTFCGTCGSPLTYQSRSEPGTLDVTAASMDDPGLFAPTHENWLEDKLPWEALNDALEGFPRSVQEGKFAGV